MTAHKGIVAAGHARTAEVAAEVLRAGGNAVDAATAAFFMACVTEPVLASLGGGGFMMVANAHQVPTVYDFFTHTPRTTRPATELDFEAVHVDFGSAVQRFHIGYGTVAVPGVVAGILGAHRAHGKMTLPELAAPAVRAARDGVVLSAMQSMIFNMVEPIYMSRPSARAIFESPATPGRPLRTDDHARFTALADVMEVLAMEGADFFYRGDIAELILRHTKQGGCLSRRDIESYQVIRRKPLQRRYRDATIFTNPPPSCGGILIMFGLALLERLMSDKHKFGECNTLLTLARVLMCTSESRLQAMCEVERGDAEPDALLDENLLAKYEAEVRGVRPAHHGTTHISIIDKNGTAVALTVTNGAGCGEVLPGGGFMLNNMLGEEDLNAGGAGGWPLNQRMSSMMAPSMMRSDDALVVTGSGGSNRIPSALLQLLNNLLSHDMNVRQAVCAPRLHWHDGVLYAEGGCAKDDNDDQCVGDDDHDHARLHSDGIAALHKEYAEVTMFPDINFFFGGCNTVRRDACGDDGCGDPRRDGTLIRV